MTTVSIVRQPHACSECDYSFYDGNDVSLLVIRINKHIREERLYHALFSYMLSTYQAYASGAEPPGPGKIASSLLLMASVMSISRARRAPSSCATERGPMMGAVTLGFASSQARPT